MHTFSSIGLSSYLTSWFYSYLCNHSQQVVLNGSSSHKSHALSGVPQGSILGPLLFIIYLNSLSDIPLSPSSKFIFYADYIPFPTIVILPLISLSFNLILTLSLHGSLLTTLPLTLLRPNTCLYKFFVNRQLSFLASPLCILMDLFLMKSRHLNT